MFDRIKTIGGGATRTTGRWARIALLTALLSGSSMVAQANVDQVEEDKKPYGAYLAGLHARATMDIGAAADYHQQALELDPDNLSLLARTFSLCIADGQYDCASRVADHLVELDRADSLIRLYQFLELARDKRFKKAREYLEQVGDAGVYSLFKPLFSAWMAAEDGDEKQASAVLEELLQKDSFRDFKKFHAALIYEFTGNDARAEELYVDALGSLGALTLRTVEAYGMLLAREGREDAARELFLNYLEKAPDNETLKLRLDQLEKGKLAKHHIDNYRDGMAEIFYSAATFLMQDNIRTPATLYLRYGKYMRKDFPEADFLLGQIFEIDEYYDGALEVLQNIKKKDHLYYQSRMQQAWIYEKIGELDKAVAMLRDLAREFPDKHQLFGVMGDLYRMNNRFAEAADAYDKLIKSFGEPEEKHWAAFYTRGIVLEREQRWDEAEKDFLKALELRPDQPQVLNYLAYSWVDRGINVDKARAMLEKAVELRPHDGYIVDSLGWALFKMGEHGRAVEVLEKAVMLQADDWAINDHLGDAYWAVGRKNEARFQWRHALSLNPDDEKVSEIKNKIKHGNSSR
ncbi:tetratricopeptide repeat protein [Emcibacter nanhaiensis]|uniref:Tetratricopeptide repeat protein n=1 Tax=Emcibacter nanhaiensis TaxID=1505037 RepID=A0A501PGB0_9PROT|nr:tetratricopeptide repeat protein [Emcibacter nanhaiensis]TPD59490.1 tetratricopeptide repeat protein [Emcibacter nanhaiensis]